jgi:hypothetical protein
MTTLASWVTDDDHGVASIYIASDSRLCLIDENDIVVGISGNQYQKTFHSRKTPDVFGVYGVVTHAPELVKRLIPSLAALRDGLPAPERTVSTYAALVAETVGRIGVPGVCRAESFGLIHGFRLAKYEFGLFHVKVTLSPGATKVTSDEVHVKPFEAISCAWATGKPGLVRTQRTDPDKAQRGFSRWHWQTFYDALKAPLDDYSGGAPQLVGIYREGNGMAFGIHFAGERFLNGRPIAGQSVPSDLEWRDGLFQRVDDGCILLLKAQKHGRVLATAKVTPYSV